jgi:excisionase family DNA binding protein
VTVQQAAKVLEVSPGLVYSLCLRGKLAHTRIGLGRGVVRIEQRDIDALKAAGRVEVVGASRPDPPRKSSRVGAAPFDLDAARRASRDFMNQRKRRS